jgi:putative acetyltransferase
MRKPGLVLAETDPKASEVATLIAALDDHLRELYPGMPIHGIEPEAFRRSGGIFLIGRVNGVAVACGAIRPLGEGVGEIKRMFVRPDHRRSGFAPVLLAALEQAAAERGYRAIRLETGENQIAAIRLYESAGYRPISAYGDDNSDSRSLYFEKAIEFSPRLDQTAYP